MDDYEQEAWDAFTAARGDWKQRDAPSVGARASAIIRGLLFPPTYITRCLAALALYLSDPQRSERRGFQSKTRRGLNLMNDG